MNRLADPMIGAAPARVGHTGIDVVVGRRRRALEKRHGGHDHPGLTIPALRDVELLPRKLHRVRSIDRQPFDGGDRGADGGFDRDGARTKSPAVEMHRARSALSDPTTVLRAREVERVAKSPEKRRLRFHIDDVLNAIDGERESHERPSSETDTVLSENIAPMPDEDFSGVSADSSGRRGLGATREQETLSQRAEPSRPRQRAD